MRILYVYRVVMAVPKKSNRKPIVQRNTYTFEPSFMHRLLFVEDTKCPLGHSLTVHDDPV